jgi:hypothetical protein
VIFSYFVLKILHIFLSIILMTTCIWSLLPVSFLCLGEKGSKNFNSAFKRMLLVVPIGFFQGILGMAVFSVDPIQVSSFTITSLIAGWVLLGIFWLSGIIAIKGLAVNTVNQVGSKIRIGAWIWASGLAFIFLAMLFIMANFKSFSG